MLRSAGLGTKPRSCASFDSRPLASARVRGRCAVSSSSRVLERPSKPCCTTRGSPIRRTSTPYLCKAMESTSSSASAVAASSGQRKIGVLFVCLGNICRSPSAEAMFRSVVEKAGLADAFDIDSCGTGGGNPDWFTEGGWSYHEGDPADSRMTLTARKRGVILTSRSRPLQPLDLTRFDYIIGMDPKNLRAIRAAADYWLVRPMGEGKVPQDYSQRLSLMTSYSRKFEGASEVPDPYYGGPAGFERVLDLLEDACVGLLESIRSEKGL